MRIFCSNKNLCASVLNIDTESQTTRSLSESVILLFGFVNVGFSSRYPCCSLSNIEKLFLSANPYDQPVPENVTFDTKADSPANMLSG
jgi:hypothetical protein